MGMYRCHACGYHTSTPKIYEDGCDTSGRGCGFRTGNFSWDNDYEVPPAGGMEFRHLLRFWFGGAVILGFGAYALFGQNGISALAWVIAALLFPLWLLMEIVHLLGMD